MHIPNHMLHGAVCPVTIAVSTAGVGAAYYFSQKSTDKISNTHWAATTALIFILQMLNFPVTNGTSGHLIGSILAVILLGMPRAILSLTAILMTQTFFFNDGGLDTLGANILNMGLISVVVGGILFNRLQKNHISRTLSITIASLASVVVAAFACTIELTLSQTISYQKIFPTMMPVHFLIGIGEAVLTILVLNSIKSESSLKTTIPLNRLLVCSCVAILATPLASQLPDGLNWSANLLQINFASNNSYFAFLHDYQINAIQSPVASRILASTIGYGILFIIILAIAQSKKLMTKIAQ